MIGEHMVVFELCGERYSLAPLHVISIYPLVEKSTTKTPNYIRVNHHMIPVINPCYQLGLSEVDEEMEKWLVVAQYKGRRVGILVDRVLEVGVLEEMTEPSQPEHLTYIQQTYKKRDAIPISLDLNGTITLAAMRG